MAENNDIPENADKILFAEDLLSYTMLRNANVHFTPWRAEPYREFIFNGFNETTKLAVRFLDSTMEMHHDDIFRFIRNANAVNEITYATFANDIRMKYFPDGFDANNFLHYCVHLASLAAYFYINGIVEAPYLAVLYIVNSFQNFDMSTGGWVTLNRIAERYAGMAQDSMNTLSPKSVDSNDDDPPEPNIIPDNAESDEHVIENNNEAGNDSRIVENTLQNLEMRAILRVRNYSGCPDAGEQKTAPCNLNESTSSANESEIEILKEHNLENKSSLINNDIHSRTYVDGSKFNPGCSSAYNNVGSFSETYNNVNPESSFKPNNKVNPGSSSLTNSNANAGSSCEVDDKLKKPFCKDKLSTESGVDNVTSNTEKYCVDNNKDKADASCIKNMKIDTEASFVADNSVISGTSREVNNMLITESHLVDKNDNTNKKCDTKVKSNVSPTNKINTRIQNLSPNSKALLEVSESSPIKILDFKSYSPPSSDNED